jgi:membrane-bound lytic murein transglycosylase B
MDIINRPHDDQPRERPPMSGSRSVSSRRLPRRVMLSVLAGGGITAASLGGPLPGGALGAEAPAGSTTTGEGAQPPVTPTTPATGPTGPSSTSTSTSTTPSTTTTSPTPSTPPPAGATGGEAPTVVVRHKQQASSSGPASANATHTKAKSGGRSTNGNKASTSGGTGAAPGAPNNVALPPQLVADQAGALAAMLGSANANAQALDFYRIPLFLLPIYRAAAIQYDVPWPILAAINEIETNYGTDLSVSSAGAEGWMQFEPSTWLQYGVDALNAGYADPYNPVDAIFAAARYLSAAGAAHNLSAAILAYNHSEAYVSSVLLRAKLIAAYPDQVIATLTGLIDGRPPVTGKRIGWGAPTSTSGTAATALPPSSSATAGATAASTSASPAGSSATPGSSAAPSPAAAATAASTTASELRLVDVRSEPDARAVAVQDGRVVKLGYSRKLGWYVILRDVYGDVFTYAGLGSIARGYELPRSDFAASASSQSPGASSQSPGVSSQSPGASSQSHAASSPSPGVSSQIASGPAGGASAAGSTPTGAGKVRVFAHPYDNPDALAAVARARASSATSVASGRLPLRSGSVVAEDTVLGRVSAPAGARDGHLRFAIQPAGDTSTIDPRAIIANWTQLDAALHPQGAHGRANLLGATASDVFLLSKSQLEREVLSDPGIALSACSRHEVASGGIDKRALAVLAFLSRSGLKPTVGTLRCGAYDASGYVSPGHTGDAVAIVAINGVPIAGHQGAGSITDTTIRTLLTLQGEFVPARIASLMHYPGAPSTLARADHGEYIEIAFTPAPLRAAGARSPATTTTTTVAAHSAGAGQTAPAPVAIVGELSVAQWEQLIGRIAALPAPNVAVKPSSAAIPDSRGPAGSSRTASSSRGPGSGSSSSGG